MDFQRHFRRQLSQPLSGTYSINFTCGQAALARRNDCNIVIFELLQPQRRFVAKWFVRTDGLKTGPFSDTEFFDPLKGKDPTGVEIWREGMSAWVPAGHVPQLIELMAPVR